MGALGVGYAAGHTGRPDQFIIQVTVSKTMEIQEELQCRSGFFENRGNQLKQGF